MRIPGDSELLAAFEAGVGRAPVHQALALLRAVLPDRPTEELARLPVGRRDELLLRLRALAFGPVLEALADCPACGETVELELPVAELLAAAPAEDAAALAVEAGGVTVAFRLPTSEDVLAVAPGAAGGVAEDPGAVATKLLERCLLAADGAAPGAGAAAGDESGGGGGAPGSLPPAVVEAVEARMAEADPLAEILLRLGCPGCGREWAVPLDVVAFVWRELAARVERTLSDVHLLASAYGWSEQAILSLSPWRRGAYLERVGG